MSRLIPLTVTLSGAIAAMLVWPAVPDAVTHRGASQAPGGPATVAPWRWPVSGEVVARFSYVRAQPFARGARRGIDLHVSPGATVRAPCRGRVTFAGRVPGTGRAVTIRCAALRATLLGLRSLDVTRGSRLAAGARLGRAVGPTLRLGARDGADRFGYVDPLTLLGAEAPRGVPLGPRVPLGRAPHGAPRPLLAPWQPLARRQPQPLARRQPQPLARRQPQPLAPPQPSVPLAAYAAIAMLAAATGVGRLARRRRAPTRVAQPAPAARPRLH